MAMGEALSFREENIEVLLTSCSQGFTLAQAVDEAVPSHHDDFASLVGTIHGFECDMMLLCRPAQEHRKCKELPVDLRKLWIMDLHLSTSCLFPLFSDTSTTTPTRHTAIFLLIGENTRSTNSP